MTAKCGCFARGSRHRRGAYNDHLEGWAMNTYEIAFAIFGLVMLAGAITGTKESAGIRLLAVVISLIALVAAALAALVSEGRR
jgi:hypothetical protein